MARTHRELAPDVLRPAKRCGWRSPAADALGGWKEESEMETDAQAIESSRITSLSPPVRTSSGCEP
jgi:hypothetical protein